MINIQEVVGIIDYLNANNWPNHNMTLKESQQFIAEFRDRTGLELVDDDIILHYLSDDNPSSLIKELAFERLNKTRNDINNIDDVTEEHITNDMHYDELRFYVFCVCVSLAEFKAIVQEHETTMFDQPASQKSHRVMSMATLTASTIKSFAEKYVAKKIQHLEENHNFLKFDHNLKKMQGLIQLFLQAMAEHSPQLTSSRQVELQCEALVSLTLEYAVISFLTQLFSINEFNDESFTNYMKEAITQDAFLGGSNPSSIVDAYLQTHFIKELPTQIARLMVKTNDYKRVLLYEENVEMVIEQLTEHPELLESIDDHTRRLLTNITKENDAVKLMVSNLFYEKLIEIHSAVMEIYLRERKPFILRASLVIQTNFALLLKHLGLDINHEVRFGVIVDALNLVKDLLVLYGELLVIEDGQKADLKIIVSCVKSMIQNDIHRFKHKLSQQQHETFLSSAFNLVTYCAHVSESNPIMEQHLKPLDVLMRALQSVLMQDDETYSEEAMQDTHPFSGSDKASTSQVSQRQDPSQASHEVFVKQEKVDEIVRSYALKIHEMESEIRREQNKVKSLKDEILVLVDQREKLKQKNRQKQNQIKQLETMVDVMSNSGDARKGLQSKYQNLLVKHKRLKQELSSLQASNRLQEEPVAQQGFVTSKVKPNPRKNKSIQLEKKTNPTKAEINKSNTRLERLRKENKNLKNKMDTLKKRYHNLIREREIERERESVESQAQHFEAASQTPRDSLAHKSRKQLFQTSRQRQLNARHSESDATSKSNKPFQVKRFDIFNVDQEFLLRSSNTEVHSIPSNTETSDARRAEQEPTTQLAPIESVYEIEPLPVSIYIPHEVHMLLHHFKRSGIEAYIYGGFPREANKQMLFGADRPFIASDVDVIVAMPASYLDEPTDDKDKLRAIKFIKENFRFDRVDGDLTLYKDKSNSHIDLCFHNRFNIRTIFETFDINVNAMLINQNYELMTPKRYLNKIKENTIELIPMPHHKDALVQTDLNPVLNLQLALENTLQEDPLRIMRFLRLSTRYYLGPLSSHVIDTCAHHIYRIGLRSYSRALDSFINDYNLFGSLIKQNLDLLRSLCFGLFGVVMSHSTVINAYSELISLNMEKGVRVDQFFSIFMALRWVCDEPQIEDWETFFNTVVEPIVDSYVQSDGVKKFGEIPADDLRQQYIDMLKSMKDLVIPMKVYIAKKYPPVNTYPQTFLTLYGSMSQGTHHLKPGMPAVSANDSQQRSGLRGTEGSITQPREQSESVPIPRSSTSQRP